MYTHRIPFVANGVLSVECDPDSLACPVEDQYEEAMQGFVRLLILSQAGDRSDKRSSVLIGGDIIVSFRRGNEDLSTLSLHTQDSRLTRGPRSPLQGCL